MPRPMVMTLSELCKYMDSPQFQEDEAKRLEEERRARDQYWEELGDFIEQHLIGVPHITSRGGIINFD